MKSIVKYCLAMICIVCLAGCGAQTDQGNEELLIDAAVSKGVPAQYPDIPVESGVPEGWDAQYPVQKLADVGAVSIYAVQEESEKIVLWDGTQTVLDWNYVTPRGVDLQAISAPWDTSQIAAAFLSGTGTCVSLYELHILEKEEDEAAYTDYALRAADCQTAVSDALQVQEKGDALHLSIGEASCALALEEKAQKAAVYPGNVISYALSADGIEMTMDIDRIDEETMVAVPIAVLQADVCLKEEQFVLTDFKLKLFS